MGKAEGMVLLLHTVASVYTPWHTVGWEAEENYIVKTLHYLLEVRDGWKWRRCLKFLMTRTKIQW